MRIFRRVVNVCIGSIRQQYIQFDVFWNGCSLEIWWTVFNPMVHRVPTECGKKWMRTVICLNVCESFLSCSRKFTDHHWFASVKTRTHTTLSSFFYSWLFFLINEIVFAFFFLDTTVVTIILKTTNTYTVYYTLTRNVMLYT